MQRTGLFKSKQAGGRPPQRTAVCLRLPHSLSHHSPTARLASRVSPWNLFMLVPLAAVHKSRRNGSNGSIDGGPRLTRQPRTRQPSSRRRRTVKVFSSSSSSLWRPAGPQRHPLLRCSCERDEQPPTAPWPCSSAVSASRPPQQLVREQQEVGAELSSSCAPCCAGTACLRGRQQQPQTPTLQQQLAHPRPPSSNGNCSPADRRAAAAATACWRHWAGGTERACMSSACAVMALAADG